jgi:pimeloyl-ACP methyl ester carboxylesterase
MPPRTLCRVRAGPSSTKQRLGTVPSRCLAIAVGALLLAACSGDSAAEPPAVTRDVSDVTDPPAATPTDPGSTAPPEPLDYEIAWTELSERVDEGWITVPVDYADPQGDTIDLYVTRHRAAIDNAIGPLLANRGGPGADGATFGLHATSWFGDDVTDNFDVIGWDPRGTGRSEGVVDCIDDDEYDRYFSTLDVTPDDDAGRQALVELAEEFAAACVDRVETLEHVGTNNSARDIDAIRQALGVDQISYFGFSYGSELGGVWTTMFPSSVRAAVFDGAADPNASPLETTLQQGAGFERALDTFLAQCSADTSCTFHHDGDSAGAFMQLMASLDATPIPSVDGRPDVGVGILAIATAQSMYSEQYWPAFERALEDAVNGDGAGLLQLHDAYYERQPDGTYTNLIEAFQAISCADDGDRPTVDEADAEVEEILEVAPRIFPYTTGSYTCTFFPEAVDPRLEITGVDAGPIVVIGTTGDPATPLESSRAMADALEDGRLVIVEANEHTGYRSDDCVRGIVHEYLLQLVAPEDETVCS